MVKGGGGEERGRGDGGRGTGDGGGGRDWPALCRLVASESKISRGRRGSVARRAMAWGWLQTMWRLQRGGVRQRARVAQAAGQARSLLGGHAAASTSAATQQRAGQRKVTKSPWSNEHGDRAGYARRVCGREILIGVRC